MVSGEELSLYGSAPNRTESAQVVSHNVFVCRKGTGCYVGIDIFLFFINTFLIDFIVVFSVVLWCITLAELVIFWLQKTFSFAVRDSLINVGPLKDFSYGLRINADANATGIAKQSNYELVSLFP